MLIYIVFMDMKLFINLLKFVPFIRFAYTDTKINKILNKEVIFVFLIYIIVEFWQYQSLFIVKNILFAVIFYLLLVLIVVIFEKLTGKYLIGGGDIKLIMLVYYTYGIDYLVLSLSFSLVFILLNLILLKLFKTKSECFSQYFVCCANNKNLRIIYAPFLALGLFLAIVINNKLSF